jgi:hypothetical protein
VNLGLFVDPAHACLLIVVTTIGLLVHIYSIGYMGHDPGYWRFFAYLNLFMFSMLLLVLADSWLVVFVAWELVGLSSYLLIGFWYRKRSAALAARRRSSSTASATSGSRSGSWPSSSNTGTLDIRESLDTLLADARRVPDPGRIVRPARVRRRDGQERPVPAPRLAARRDGGPDPGVGPDPRRDDGQRRRVPRRPGQPDLRQRPATMVRSARSASSPRSWRVDRDDPDRHQAGAGVFDVEQLGYMFASLGVGAFTPRSST